MPYCLWTQQTQLVLQLELNLALWKCEIPLGIAKITPSISRQELS